MLVEPEVVANDLNVLWTTEFAGYKTGRYLISKAQLRVLSGRDSLQTSILLLIMAAAYVNHDLILLPVDGTIDTAKNFGVMQELPDWREVPDKKVAALARG